MSQLPADCLSEIFEYLEEDEITLRSCLLVNRLWCEVSVRILWRSIRNYNTLIACLPSGSKEILYKDGIITSITTSKPPMFNYAKFCKFLSINDVNDGIKQLFKNLKSARNQQSTPPQSLNDNIHTVTARGVLKLLMSQASLKEIIFYSRPSDTLKYIPNFTSFPGTKDCLKNLSELRCDSDIYPEFFCQLSQICHNLQSIGITFEYESVISNGLADLISVQKNLKCLKMTVYEDLTADIITSLTKLPNTLTKLHIVIEQAIPLSFITKFTNLQEIILSFSFEEDYFKDLKSIQYATFPQLQILAFQFASPRHELLIKFLEINGNNLKELYADSSENSSTLAMVKFCPNLRKLSIKCNEPETLKKIFNNCQYLESIRIWCGTDNYLSENELLEIVAEYSPRNVHELKLCYDHCDYERGSELLPEELESFFISWENRLPQKSLSFIIIHNQAGALDYNDENMQIIEEYIELGIIKEFKTLEYEYDDFY